MNPTDRQRVIAELDVLSSQVIELMQRFEATGANATMRDDYVELHALQNRLIEQRRHHSQAIDAVLMPCGIPNERH
jgi:hypothetical protein